MRLGGGGGGGILYPEDLLKDCLTPHVGGDKKLMESLVPGLAFEVLGLSRAFSKAANLVFVI